MAGIDPETDDISNLIVRMSDSRAAQVIWRGIIVGAISDDNAQKNSDKFQRGIAKRFKDYPRKSNE
jgi:hypothetical protein